MECKQTSDNPVARLPLPAVSKQMEKEARMNIALLGGNWDKGSYAGRFALNINDAHSYANIPLPFCFPLSLMVSAERRKSNYLPKSEYPDYIPKKWIHLSRHSQKLRTRKKWKHQIEKEIRLHEKRAPKTKGTNA